MSIPKLKLIDGNFECQNLIASLLKKVEALTRQGYSKAMMCLYWIANENTITIPEFETALLQSLHLIDDDSNLHPRLAELLRLLIQIQKDPVPGFSFETMDPKLINILADPDELHLVTINPRMYHEPEQRLGVRTEFIGYGFVSKDEINHLFPGAEDGGDEKC